jgi:hypothetical protein
MACHIIQIILFTWVTSIIAGRLESTSYGRSRWSPSQRNLQAHTSYVDLTFLPSVIMVLLRKLTVWLNRWHVRTKNFHQTEDYFGFLWLQSCLLEILISKAGNTYKTPHIGKAILLSRLGTLPVHITATANACVVARVVMWELDGEFQGDAKGTVEGSQSK